MTDWILALAASPFVYLVVALLCIIDGFFPPVPSETVVVALGAIGASSDDVSLPLVIVAGAVGALAGDSLAYLLGRKVGTDRFAWMRRPRVAKVIAWTSKGFAHRPAMLLFVARYIPVGRIAVNMTAGASKFPYRRFALIDAIAGFGWAAANVGIGALTGSFIAQPLLAAASAVIAAMLIGVIVDRIAHAITRRREHTRPEQALQPLPSAPTTGASPRTTPALWRAPEGSVSDQ